MILFICSECGKENRLLDTLEGKEFACTDCREAPAVFSFLESSPLPVPVLATASVSDQDLQGAGREEIYPAGRPSSHPESLS